MLGNPPTDLRAQRCKFDYTPVVIDMIRPNIPNSDKLEQTNRVGIDTNNFFDYPITLYAAYLAVGIWFAKFGRECADVAADNVVSTTTVKEQRPVLYSTSTPGMNEDFEWILTPGRGFARCRYCCGIMRSRFG